MGSLEICNHCKKQREFLNYNSKNDFSLWADMMEIKLQENKHQNLDDENQFFFHNLKF